LSTGEQVYHYARKECHLVFSKFKFRIAFELKKEKKKKLIQHVTHQNGKKKRGNPDAH
jgi:hypothetical protein